MPAFTAYGDPKPDALRVSSSKGITGWNDPAEKIVWFGEVKTPGKLTAGLALTLRKDAAVKLIALYQGLLVLVRAGFDKRGLKQAIHLEFDSLERT